MLAAFAMGIVVGAWWKSGDEKLLVVTCATPELEEYGSDAFSVADSAVDTIADESSPAAVVEEVADNSPAPDASVTAAHQARRAQRAAARAAKKEQRRDFLASLNLDLLTSDQQKVHAEYTEAVMVRDAALREIAALIARGEEVPAELHDRLNDAVSVVRADADEEHALLRAAAARAAGVDETRILGLLSDLESVDELFCK